MGPLSNGVDALLDLSDTTRSDWPWRHYAVLGDPLRLVLRLHNRRGVAAPMPHVLVNAVDGTLLLSEGLSLRIFREAADPGADEQEIAPSLAIVRMRSTETQIVPPGAEAEATSLDLARCFLFSEPGIYRIELRFSSADGAFTDGELRPLSVYLERPLDPGH